MQKPKLSRFLSKNTVLGAFSLLLGGAAYSQTYQPLTVTGFNHDVIANGTGPALESTTTSVDNSANVNANFAFLSLDFKQTAESAAATFGLPVDGLLTSPNVTGLTYALQPYTGNNSLRLPNQNDSGTLTLTTPTQLQAIYLAVSSGDGSSVISVEVNFADGTSQTVTGLAVTNWDSNPATGVDTPAIISNIGRVKRTSGVTSSGNFRLFQITVPIELANQAKLVNSIEITKTDTGSESKIPNIFAVSGKTLGACPAIATTAGAPATYTSANISWTLGSLGTGGTAATYTVEVYTDAAFTTAVTGSPFTGITGTSQTVTGLTLDTTYYYRVKANNGSCDSDYATGSFLQGYCAASKTGTGTAYYISNVGTSNGYTNIANNTGTTIASTGYTNFADTQSVSKSPGTTFNYTVTRSDQYASLGVWVDWNNDLDFTDEGETIHTSTGAWSQPTVVNGTITIPEGTPLGSYRMRVRSCYYWLTTLSPCGGLATGEAEDYTIHVITQPADCDAPAAPTIAAVAANTTITATITPAATAPSGYILVRSTAATLTAEPVTGTNYVAGTALGGGTVVANSATLTFSDFVAANTKYYYFVYAYNQGSLTCFGPRYSTSAVANATTCAKAVQVAGASNITHISANLNWSNIVGPGGTAATYTVEVYTDAALTALFGSYTSTTNTYALTGLTNAATYWYRVKGEAGDCDNDAWSGASSFTAGNGFTPVDVTGHNADVIANGTGIANTSTNNAVDGVSNSYVALDYEKVSGTVTTVGLPLNRTLTAAAPNAGLKFLLPDYGSNNALRLPAQNQEGTFTLATPRKFSDVYLSLTSGSGGSTITAELEFQDGTTQAVSTFTLIDWYQGGSATQPALISNIGRANRANAEGNVETGNSKIFYVTIPVEAANQDKYLSSIVITKTSTGATEPVPNIFSVSGKAKDVCPALEPAANSNITGTGATLNWTLVAGSAAVDSYTVEVFTDAAYTTPVTGSPFTGITETTYTLTGLNASTPYFFRVKGINVDCTSGYFEGSFNTSCVTPAVPTASAQTFCGATTVSQLVATGTTGTTIKWYATETATTPLAGTAAVTTGTYYVSQLISICESARVPVVVTVNTTAVPTAAAQAFCGSATVADLTATILEGATVSWSTTANGTALAATTALTTGTYYVKQTVDGCASTAVAVAITVTPAPVAPSANATQAFCGSATVANLTAIGTGITWSATQGGTALEATAALTTGTYYVTQTINGCTSAATPVAVTVTALPTLTITNPAAACAPGTVDITAAAVVAGSDAGLTYSYWADPFATVTFPDPDAIASSGTFYIKAENAGGCSVISSVVVVVNSTAVPAAEAQTLCGGATAADIEVTGETGATFTWYATEGGAAIAATEVLTTGTYYVAQTVNGCISAAIPVAITINTTPAVVAETQSFCGEATVADLEATPAEGATAVWSATQGGAALAGTEALVSGTYYVTQTINDCTSTATAVVVSVTAIPDAPAGEATQTFEEGSGDTVADLDITTVAGATVTWYIQNIAMEYEEIPATTALTDGGVYYATQSVNGCVSPYFSVTVSQVTSIKNFGLSRLSVYPNPTQDIITLTNSEAITKVEVVNLLGQTVITQNTNTETVQVDLSKLASGTYLVRVATANANATVKVVKK
ncbi:hypothetical protein AM493_14695 [Flavobacterium akiainvivens]|uniref:Fibronectin type-III domain-containing protein n=1 Tax=Flavobacterium akiainvivens TaxID=1202724 RepID=A0A0N0RQX0_9FLAO|nr:hypothetical protein AM493_14695 [Flavobacterium akiainvivens]